MRGIDLVVAKELEVINRARETVEGADDIDRSARVGHRCDDGKILQIVRASICIAGIVEGDAVKVQINPESSVRKDGITPNRKSGHAKRHRDAHSAPAVAGNKIARRRPCR